MTDRDIDRAQAAGGVSAQLEILASLSGLLCGAGLAGAIYALVDLVARTCNPFA